MSNKKKQTARKEFYYKAWVTVLDSAGNRPNKRDIANLEKVIADALTRSSVPWTFVNVELSEHPDKQHKE